MSHRLSALLNPTSVALVGASNNPARIGGMPLDLLGSRATKGAGRAAVRLPGRADPVKVDLAMQRGCIFDLQTMEQQ